MKAFKIIFLLIWVIGLLSWPLNVYRVFQCDFDSNKSWKGEIIHGIGIFTPTCVVTAWTNWDK